MAFWQASFTVGAFTDDPETALTWYRLAIGLSSSLGFFYALFARRMVGIQSHGWLVRFGTAATVVIIGWTLLGGLDGLNVALRDAVQPRWGDMAYQLALNMFPNGFLGGAASRAYQRDALSGTGWSALYAYVKFGIPLPCAPGRLDSATTMYANLTLFDYVPPEPIRLSSVNKPALTVNEIEIAGLKRVNPAMVERQLTVRTGEPLANSNIDNDVLRIYGDGFYQGVDYRLVSYRDRNILRVLPVEKSWGPDYLRFALNLETDSNQGSSFSLRAAYQKTLINELGAEFLATVGIGSNVIGGLNFYQPLDPAQRFFVEAGLNYNRGPLDIYQDNSRIAQYTNSQTELGLWAGTNIGIMGQAKIGWIEQKRSFERDIGSLLLPDFDTSYSGWKASLSLDQRNRLHFATRGWLARFEYFDSSEAGYSRADADLGGAFSLGKTVFTGRATYAGSIDGPLPFYDAAKLGGFMHMSAFARNQILGDDISYASLRAEQIIGTFPIGLRGDIRLGVVLEGAHVGKFYTETNLAGTDILDSAAVYMGGETPLGPAYLGFGYSTSGASNFFLSIGIQ